jgi:hypothetical protein
MWGNLAGKVGKVGAQDWNAALKKIGNAVAPPHGDEDEYEDDEEYDEDDDYEEEYEEEDDSEPTGFGFVGMLARALDREDEEHEEESYSNNAEESFEPVGASSVPPVDTWSQEPPVPMTKERPSVKVKPVASAAPPAQIDQSPVVSASTKESSWAPEKQSFVQEPIRKSSNDELKQLQRLDPPISGDKKGGVPEYSKFQDSTTASSSSRVEGRNGPAPPAAETAMSNTATRKASMQPTTKKISKPVNTHANQRMEVPTPQRQQVGDPDAEDRPADMPLHQDTRQRPSGRAMEPANLAPTGIGGAEAIKPVKHNYHESTSAFLLPATHLPVPPAAKVEPKQRPNTEVNPQIKSKPSTGPDQTSSYHDREKDLLLQQAEEKILALQSRLNEETEKADQMRETMMIRFQEKEARILQASQEEYQHEMAQAEHIYQAEMQSLEMRLANEKNEYVKGQQKLQEMVEQSNVRADKAETDLRNLLKSHESQLAQVNNQEQRAIRMTEDKLAQSMALLDERDEEISQVKAKVKKLESSMNEHEEGVEEVEQEVEELHDENEALQEQVERLETECVALKDKVATLEGETSQLGELQMELTMLREDRDRERTKNQSVVQSTITSHSQVESERDSALAEVRDLKQHLTAALADLEIARADQERILTANSNLQSALEAFQDERQAEMSLVDEQRMEAEEAIKCAHAGAVEALKQTHAEEIRQVQLAAEASVKHAMEETRELQATLNKVKNENAQTRRSLDEAIHRLQTTQEDIIDRTLMKNILLDWCTMKEKAKRHQVLQLMASVLHFTDEEKEKVHLTHMDIESVRAKVVGALALPPSNASLEALEGENVSEKWVNFLMAETDDGL